MQKLITILLLSLSVTLLPSCAAKKQHSSSTPPTPIQPTSPPLVEERHPTPKQPQQASTQQLLNQAYSEWAGVPHQDGGFSKQGVDCSGFVHLVFKQQLKQTVPRSTKSFAVAGTQVSQTQLKPGDLVLFKIRRGVQHIGIYSGDGQFIHASKSKGVWRSQLALKYWQDHYWQSRRILE